MCDAIYIGFTGGDIIASVVSVKESFGPDPFDLHMMMPLQTQMNIFHTIGAAALYPDIGQNLPEVQGTDELAAA